MEHMKKSLKYNVYQYTAIFESDREVGGYTVTIPELPGCISEGDTFEKALANIEEAASLYIEVMKKKKDKTLAGHPGIIIAPVQIKV